MGTIFMLICDGCDQPLEDDKRVDLRLDIRTPFSDPPWQNHEFDLCAPCFNEWTEKIRASHTFKVGKKKREEELQAHARKALEKK